MKEIQENLEKISIKTLILALIEVNRVRYDKFKVQRTKIKECKPARIIIIKKSLLMKIIGPQLRAILLL